MFSSQDIEEGADVGLIVGQDMEGMDAEGCWRHVQHAADSTSLPIVSLSAPVILTGYAHRAQNKKYDYCACRELTGVSIGRGELNCSELLLVDVYVL